MIFFEYINFRNEIFKLISIIGRHVLKLTSSTRVGYILELKRCCRVCVCGTFLIFVSK
jgi:hypothetical protein